MDEKIYILTFAIFEGWGSENHCGLDVLNPLAFPFDH